jgi:predicted PurR-regulated permease PerM
MSIGAAIIGFFSALPEIIKLVQQLMTWINHASGNDPQGYIKKISEALAKLNAAKTEQERIDAAKAIADAIHGLP